MTAQDTQELAPDPLTAMRDARTLLLAHAAGPNGDVTARPVIMALDAAIAAVEQSGRSSAEPVPNSILQGMFSVADERRAIAESRLATAEKDAYERAAKLIEESTISYGDTNTLRKRLEGDKQGLEYATAIRALSNAVRETGDG